MASKPRPQRLTRAQLQSFLGDDQQLIRAFEAYIKALAELTPDELNALRTLTEDAQALATRASIAAKRSQRLADELATLQQTQRKQGAELAALRRQLQELRHLTLGG